MTCSGLSYILLQSSLLDYYIQDLLKLESFGVLSSIDIIETIMSNGGKTTKRLELRYVIPDDFLNTLKQLAS